MATWLIVLLWLLWTVFCIATGVLLSRRLIITSTELYARLYHSERATLGELNYLKARIAAKAKTVESEVSGEVKKILTPQ